MLSQDLFLLHDYQSEGSDDQNFMIMLLRLQLIFSQVKHSLEDFYNLLQHFGSLCVLCVRDRNAGSYLVHRIN